MRHFFALPFPPARLAAGMMEAAPKRLLVAPPGGPQTLPPGRLRARRWAIALPVITASADAQLLMTPGTVPQSVADDVDRTTSSPQRLDAAAQSRHCRLRDTRNSRSQRRLPEGSRWRPRAFTFCGARSCYRAGGGKKTIAVIGTARRRRGRKRIRSTKHIDQKCGERFRRCHALFARSRHILSTVHSGHAGPERRQILQHPGYYSHRPRTDSHRNRTRLRSARSHLWPQRLDYRSLILRSPSYRA